MKVTMYMAPTPNGMIAKENYNEDYVSAGDWKLFTRRIRHAGNVVIGRRTFEVALKSGVFPIAGALNVVMTSKEIKNRWGNKVVFTSKTPKAVLRFLKGKGYSDIMVAGGSAVNTSFIKLKLIDEILLDVQPEIFGKGTALFASESFDAKLKLLGVTRLSKNEIQLRYKVLKKRKH